MPKEGNIYDLVEHAAARRAVPRLELWQNVARALVNRELPALNLSVLLAPKTAPAMTIGAWLLGFRSAVDRHNDPSRCAHILKQIIVRVADFEKWLRKAADGPRGPQHGTTGYAALDRKLFPQLKAMVKKGDARAAYGAAKKLAFDGKIAGKGTHENRAKRLATRYLRERKI